MKWNCNIVKLMYERVLRRKFGLLCIDDTSNKEFVDSYINRLDCTDINLQCVDSQPCPNLPVTTDCTLDVNITYTIDATGLIYTFTATPINGTAPFVYDWSYILIHWIFISQTGNTIQLKPAIYGSLISTGVGITLTDSVGCEIKKSIPVEYEKDSLKMEIGYVCDIDNNGIVCVTATGGAPPYTVVGTPGGVILTDGGSICVVLPNGSNYGAFVTDSVGNTTIATLGLIACPFDCNTITLLDNASVVCLTNEFGNTGQATLTVTPSGGTAPYIITGTINGIPGFVNGQVVNNGDVIIVEITDDNACSISNEYTIVCPPYIPEPTEFTCDDIAAGLNVEVFTYSIVASPLGFPLFGHQVDYNISWSVTNLGTFGLTSANISNVQYEISNTFANVYGQFSLPSLLGCNPCIANVPYFSNPGFRAYINSVCGDNKYLNLTIKLTFTIVNGEEICTICFEKDIERLYICGQVPSTPSGTGMDNIEC